MSVLRWPCAFLLELHHRPGSPAPSCAGSSGRHSQSAAERQPCFAPLFDLAQGAAAPGSLPKELMREDFPMRKAPDLTISSEKVFFIIAKARQSDGTATELNANSASA